MCFFSGGCPNFWVKTVFFYGWDDFRGGSFLFFFLPISVIYAYPAFIRVSAWIITCYRPIPRANKPHIVDNDPKLLDNQPIIVKKRQNFRPKTVFFCFWDDFWENAFLFFFLPTPVLYSYQAFIRVYS
jgi:hypothetical protein